MRGDMISQAKPDAQNMTSDLYSKTQAQIYNWHSVTLVFPSTATAFKLILHLVVKILP